MSLHETVESINRNLRQGRFPNEQAISQGIVLRLLKDLEWDTWDPGTVWPEFQTGEGRVDFALCHPPKQPKIFVEVKQPGHAEIGVRQALEYAFHTGVPSVVLTDGRTWSFYLPAEAGSYEERRVYKLDLFERSPEEVAKRLAEYLHYDRVTTGEALETARKEYRSKNRSALAKKTIPAAWQELVVQGESLLIEIVQDAVESKCGVRPDDADVLSFLRGVAAVEIQAPAPTPAALPAFPPLHPVRLHVVSPRAGTIRFLTEEIQIRNALEATLLILRKLAAKDPTFIPRCAAHPENFGRKRAYIAKTTEELFPDRPDLRPKHEIIAEDWLLNTNVNNAIKTRIVKLACEVAELKFGTDIQIDF